MKAHIHICLFFCFFTLRAFAQYDHNNIELMSHWKDNNLQSFNNEKVKYSSTYGWYDNSKKREYAIFGGRSGTYFIDVTNPNNPVLSDFVAGRRDSCIWREYRTYQHYAYMVSDDGVPNSFQIVDLQYLPDSVHVVHDDTSIIYRAHTLYIDKDRLYLASPRGNWGSATMAVYSLTNPEKPSLLRKLDQDYSGMDNVHDMWARNDTVYVSDGYKGLFIYTFKSNNTFSLIGSLTFYPQQGYNHSSSLTPNGKTLIFCDELPVGRAVKSLDVSDMMNLTVVDTFRSNPGSTPHNPYIVSNDRAVLSYYCDGVQVFDISNPSKVTRSGYFDTDTLDGPSNAYPFAYNGCWGVYAYLPSGILLAGDRQNGLYVLDARKALGVKIPEAIKENRFQVYPNPVLDKLNIDIALVAEEKLLFEIYDNRGRLVMQQQATFPQGNNVYSLNFQNLSKGNYMLKISEGESIFKAKILKQ